MIRRLFFFHIVLFASLAAAYFIHLSNTSLNNLHQPYIINALAAMFVYIVAYFFRNKHKEYLGFYFLSGTLLKFFVFLVFILPSLQQEGSLSKEAYMSFFVPYAISLIVETVCLISLVNKVNK